MACRLFIFNVILVFGYYEEFTFVLGKTICQLFYKEVSVNCHIYQTVNGRLMLMKLNVFSNLKFNFDCNQALFHKSKINTHGV